MKRCPVCGKWSMTTSGLMLHLASEHQPTAKPRRCLICAGETHGADAFCGECQLLSPDEILTALAGLVELGEINDFDTPECSYAEHMTDTNEPPRKHWYAVVTALVAHYGIVLDDGAGYGE